MVCCVETEDEATHIVYGMMDDQPEEKTLRPVLCRDQNYLVHWYYTSDAHDSWISNVNNEDVEISDDGYEFSPPYEVHQLNI